MAQVPPSRYRWQQNASTQTRGNASSSHEPRSDPFYGHEETARLCARFISHLFPCPETPAPSSKTPKLPPLSHFISYALHRTKLPSVITFGALLLLHRLKTRFPSARGSYGSRHRLFLTAYMLASKILCEDTYSNKSWAIVAQNIFTLREINQMEREMFEHLELGVNGLSMTGDAISTLEAKIKQDFRGSGPYPTYSPQELFEPIPVSSSPNIATPAADSTPELPHPPNPPSPSAPPSSYPPPSSNPLEILRNSQSWNLNDSVLSNVGRDQLNNNQGIVIQNLTLIYGGNARTPPKREIVKGQSVLGIWTTIYPEAGNIRHGQSRVLPNICPIARVGKPGPLGRQTC